FDAERSNVLMPGPTSGFLGELPYCRLLRSKAAVLNQRAASRSPPAILACWPDTRLGRSHRPSIFWLSPLCVTLKGKPLCTLTSPPSCQPRSRIVEGPFRFLASGRSHT